MRPELNGAVGNCRTQLEDGCDDTRGDDDHVACTETVPRDPPTVAATRYHDRDTSDGTPGRILVLTGTDRLGRTYRSEVMVFRDNRRSFKAINAVYWSNSRIVEGNEPAPSGAQ